MNIPNLVQISHTLNVFSSHANIWNFDLGKLVVPSVFMDYDLLEAMAKNYDQAIRVVRRTDG